MKIAAIIVMAIVTVLLLADAARSTTFVTGSQILNNTITAADLGPDVTRVKTVSVSLQPGSDVLDPNCDPDVNGDCPVIREGVGRSGYDVKCNTGNVTGGGVKSDDEPFVYESYPASDDTWHFTVENSQDTPVSVQLRVVCF